MKLPEDVDEDDALLLTDVLPTGYQAAGMGGIAEGDAVAVFGCGPVGLAAARCAWLLGAARASASTRWGSRRAAPRCCSGGSCGSRRAIALSWAIHAVRKGGTISVGVYGPPANLVPIGVAMNEGLTFRLAQADVKRPARPRLVSLVPAALALALDCMLVARAGDRRWPTARTPARDPRRELAPSRPLTLLQCGPRRSAFCPQ